MKKLIVAHCSTCGCIHESVSGMPVSKNLLVEVCIVGTNGPNVFYPEITDCNDWCLVRYPVVEGKSYKTKTEAISAAIEWGKILGLPVSDNVTK